MIPWRLDWLKCPDGYRIDDPKAKPPKDAVFIVGEGWRVPKEKRAAQRSGSLLLTGGAVPQIARNSSKLAPCEPLFDTPALCRKLADCPKTPEGVLQFVGKHGFLKTANARAEYLDEIYGLIDTAQEFVRIADAKDWHQLAWLLDNWGQGRELFPHGGVGRLGILFSFAEGAERPDLRLRPANLFNAALVQLLDEVSRGGEPPKRCSRPGCPEYFTYGPGTGRRKRRGPKWYCSPRCQKAHEYMRRKESQS